MLDIAVSTVRVAEEQEHTVGHPGTVCPASVTGCVADDRGGRGKGRVLSAAGLKPSSGSEVTQHLTNTGMRFILAA